MAWNGSGTFTRTDGSFSGATVWQQEAAVPTNILATKFDTHDYDLAQGINACLAKNGENSMTGTLNGVRSKWTSVTAVSLASTNHALETGSPAGLNMAFDTTNIQARNNGNAASLALNAFGGGTAIGSFAAGITLQINGQTVISDTQVGSVPTPPTHQGSIPTASVQGNLAIQVMDLWGGAVATPAYLAFRKSRGVNGTHTIVTNGDPVGEIDFLGSNGTAFDRLASIVGAVDATPGAAGDMPGRLDFSTTPDGTATVRLALRIDNAGVPRVMGSTSPGLGGSQTPFLAFAQADNTRIGYVGFSGTGLNVASENNGGVLSLQAKDSGGTLRTLLTGDPAGITEASYNGTVKFRTALETANGKGVGAEVKDGTGVYQPIGLGVLTSNPANTNYTFALNVMGQFIGHTSGGPHTWTTPANSDATLPTGYFVMGYNATGSLTVAAGASVTLTWYDGSGTLRTGSRTIAVSGVFTLIRVDASNYTIFGTGIS